MFLCPFKVLTIEPLFVFQMMISESSEPLAKKLSGSEHRAVTAPLWPLKVFIALIEDNIYHEEIVLNIYKLTCFG